LFGSAHEGQMRDAAACPAGQDPGNGGADCTLIVYGIRFR
jgi:hypothetical protein